MEALYILHNNILKISKRKTSKVVSKQYITYEHNYKTRAFIVCFVSFSQIELVTGRRFCTQRLLHTNAFTYKSFYTPHTGAFTPRSFAHNCVSTLMLLLTDIFTHRRIYTQLLFYTPTLLHIDALTHRSLYKKTLLHIEAFTPNPFTHRRFYTQKLLHKKHFYT